MTIRTVAITFALLVATAFSQWALGQEGNPADLPAEAPAPQYQIEVMIFAYPELDRNEERFNHRRPMAEIAEPSSEQLLRREPPRFDNFGLESLTVPEVPDQFGAADGGATAFHFRLLQPNELTLTSQYRALQRIPAYVPLLHGGWVQQGLPEDQARPVDVALLGALNPSGSIRLHLTRFLNLRIDLSYQSNSRRESPAGPAFGSRELNEIEVAPRYQLIAERLARSGELHYFDHPAFGVLVKVTPLPENATPVAPRGAEPAA